MKTDWKVYLSNDTKTRSSNIQENDIVERLVNQETGTIQPFKRVQSIFYSPMVDTRFYNTECYKTLH